jgi:DNA-binding response OmpR family regulator
MKVLMIDEDEFIIDLYERVFKKELLDVETARDAASAQSLLSKMDPLPDVILMEVKNSEGNGFEFLKSFKSDERYKKIPVIVLTNLYSYEDRKRGMAAGAHEYLIKSEHDPKDIITHIMSAANY